MESPPYWQITALLIHFDTTIKKSSFSENFFLRKEDYIILLNYLSAKEAQLPKSAIKIAPIITKIIDVRIQATNTLILVSIICLAISSKDTQIEMITNTKVPTKYMKPAKVLLSNKNPHISIKIKVAKDK